MFTRLYEMAQELNRLLNTEYAEKNPERWNYFEMLIKKAYADKKITAGQFKELVLLAFYDYFDEMPEDEEN